MGLRAAAAMHRHTDRRRRTAGSAGALTGADTSVRATRRPSPLSTTAAPLCTLLQYLPCPPRSFAITCAAPNEAPAPSHRTPVCPPPNSRIALVPSLSHAPRQTDRQLACLLARSSRTRTRNLPPHLLDHSSQWVSARLSFPHTAVCLAKLASLTCLCHELALPWLPFPHHFLNTRA